MATPKRGTFLGADSRAAKLDFAKLAPPGSGRNLTPVFLAIEENGGEECLFLLQTDGPEAAGVWCSPAETRALYDRLRKLYEPAPKGAR